jgi:predicted permease
MRALKRFFKRLRALARRHQDEERLRAEIEEHLALQTADNIHAGLSPVDARRQAVLKFGAVEAIRESYREQRGFATMETLLQDTRYAVRRLRMAPSFTVTAVLTLALGIGATTSIFSLVHAVLLKSLPVTNPAELYRLGTEARCCYWGGYSQEKGFSLVSYDLYKYFRDNTTGFSELAAFSAAEPLFGVRRAETGEPARGYPGEYVSGNYFTMFGIRAYGGRAIGPEDDQAGAEPAAMMSYRLWEKEYGRDQAVIGGVFNLNDKLFTVVGITPPGFFGDRLRDTPPDFFLPLNTEALLEGDLNKHDLHWLDIIGRVQPGAKPASIEAEMRVELKEWLRSHWGEMTANDRANFSEQTLFLAPGGAGISSMREEYGHWLRILMMASGFVLMIVCANLANLILVRGLDRRQQTALSMALGARASRLVRQAFTESILLSFLGGAAGLAVAFAGTNLILRFAFPRMGGMAAIPVSASPSIPVLIFAFGVSLTTGVAFGVAPAWMATRVDPMEALRGTGRSTARTALHSRKALVVFQAALSLVLLSASGLLTAALLRLENQVFGFNPERRVVAHTDPRLAGYRPDQLTPLYGRIHDSLCSIGGVSAVALCTYSPFGGNNWGGGVWVDGHAAPGPGDEAFASWDRVTGNYFEVTGNPILRGRGITEEDTGASPRVAVINEAFARKFFENEDPIGKHFGQHGVGSEREYEIVGIAKDARYLDFDLDKPIGPFFFLPEAQHDFSPTAFLPPSKPTDANPGSHFMHDIVIVTRPGAHLSDEQVLLTMASIDPNLPIISIRSLKEQVAAGFKQQRLIAGLSSFFGVLSLALASIGLYGVTAYNARSRVVEIGVRMALGADRSHVVRLVIRGAFGLILFGLLFGLPLTIGAGRFLGSQLYGMNPDNPAVTIAAVVALALSGLAASLIPALRASSISPLDALRAE